MATRNLELLLIGSDKSASRALKGLGSQAQTTSKHVSLLGKAGKVAGIGLAAGLGAAVAGLGYTLKVGFGEVKDYQAGLSQLQAGIKSTGGAANVTAPYLEKLASSIQRYSGQTDDSIVKTESLLLTFPAIRNEAGKTNDIFDQTVKIAADMAARMGTDASAAAVKLGKALNDPVAGITALTRVGVVFTAEQKAQISALVASGKTMEAQKIILAELTKEFGGSAKAFGETMPGQIEIAKRSFEDLSQQLVTALLPAINKGLKFAIDDIIPALQSFVGGLTGAKNATGDAADAGREVARIWREDVGPALEKAWQIVQAGAGFLRDHKTEVVALGTAYLGLKTAMAIGGVITRTRTAVSGLGMSFGMGAAGGIGLSGAIGVATLALAAHVREQMEVKRMVDGVKSTLDEQTGAWTRNTRAFVANELEQSGALKSSQELGIALDDVTDAAMGNSRAQNRVAEAINRAYSEGKISGIEMMQLKAKIIGQNNALNEATEAWQRNKEAMGGVNAAMQAGIDKARLYRHELKLLDGTDVTVKVVTEQITKHTRFDAGVDARARGGPVLPQNMYLVGENGPEMLVMGGSKGYVVPNKPHASDYQKMSMSLGNDWITAGSKKDFNQLKHGNDLFLGYHGGVNTGPAPIVDYHGLGRNATIGEFPTEGDSSFDTSFDSGPTSSDFSDTSSSSGGTIRVKGMRQLIDTGQTTNKLLKKLPHRFAAELNGAASRGAKSGKAKP